MRLISLHGGTIEVRSEGLGKGSEFTVRLPSASGSQHPARDLASTRGRVAPPVLRILVVDDNVDMAMSLSIIFQMHGHIVELRMTEPPG